MDHCISFYRKRLELQNADFLSIDHDDTMIALVYKVTKASGEQLILKICPRKEDYLRELYFLKHLANAHLVPQIIHVVEPEDGTYGAILMEHLEGALLQTVDWTKTLAYEIGVALARIHLNDTVSYGDPTRPQDLTSDARIYFGQKFEEELTECNDHLPQKLMEKCRLFYHSHLNLLATVDGPCMVHRDFRPGNLMVFNGKLQGIIDWASGRFGFAEQDFCSLENGKLFSYEGCKKALLAGYSNIRPIPNYNAIMPLLQLGKALAVVGFTVKSGKWNSDNAPIYQSNRRYIETFTF